MSLTKTVIRVAIADDHACFREGLKLVLTKQGQGSIEIVAESRDGEDLLRCVQKHRPEVVLTDIQMPQMNGVQVCKEISQAYPAVEIIAMSCFDDPALIYKMLDAGAKGYVSKTALPSEMIEAIHTVHKGQPYYCNHISRKLVRLIAPSKHNCFSANGNVHLSENEVAVMKLICQQLTTREIADKVNLCVKSVENYSKQIKEKTQAKNLVGIAMFAIKYGYVSVQDL